MALQISIENAQGVPCTYWRVTSINNDFANHRSSFIVSGYYDQAARDAGKEPVFSRDFVEPIDTFGDEGATRDGVYQFVKSQEGWAAAEDI